MNTINIKEAVISRNNLLEYDKVDNELVFYCQNERKVITLNQSATLIWNLVSSPKNFNELLTEYIRQFSNIEDENEVREDLIEVIEILCKACVLLVE